MIRDPATLPILHRFLRLPGLIMRQEVLFAVRAINSSRYPPQGNNQSAKTRSTAWDPFGVQ